MRAEGLSYSQIGARLHITKNSAIRQGRRLGLPRQERAERAAAGERPGRWLLPPSRKAAVAAPHSPLGASLAAAAAVQVVLPPPPAQACQWPLEAAQRQDWRGGNFCGAPVAANKPYCAAHCAVAYHRRGTTGDHVTAG
jgi:GcrA cell cycle regulator